MYIIIEIYRKANIRGLPAWVNIHKLEVGPTTYWPLPHLNLNSRILQFDIYILYCFKNVTYPHRDVYYSRRERP